MDVFIMHVGKRGSIDLDHTVTKSRSVGEILDQLPVDATERGFFESNILASCFPNGTFNCWGAPVKAEPSFRKTKIGDLVLFAPEIGLEGGIEHIGIVKAVCPIQCYEASRILWPETPDERLFPWLFFFNTESGHVPWDRFLAELSIAGNWSPRGWYKPIAGRRFLSWGGGEGYLRHLRSSFKFNPIFSQPPVTQPLRAPEVQEAIEAVSVLAGKRRRSSSQGFQVSPRIRKAIELKAMEMATEYFHQLGWIVKDVSPNKPYDLNCMRGDDELHVEVKGTTSSGAQILLTPNEVKHAQRKYPDMALFIAINLQVDNTEDDLKVTGKEFKVFMPWELKDEDIKPIGFVCKIADGRRLR